MTHWNGLDTPRRYWSVAAIWLAMTMAVLDASIANVALPTIARDLKAAGAEAIWVVNAYQLAIVVSLLPLAALGEIFTYRRVYLGGLVLFVGASFFCAFSQTLWQLALFRVVQGLGAAGVMSVNGALLRYTYPQNLFGRAIGMNAFVVSIAAVVGPSVASGILSVARWPWLFAVNVPFGLAAVILARKALPDSPRSGRSLDWIAAGLNVLTFGAIITGIDVLTRAAGPGSGRLRWSAGSPPGRSWCAARSASPARSRRWTCFAAGCSA